MYTFSISQDYYLIRDTLISSNNVPYNFQDGENPEYWKPNLAANVLHIKVCKGNEFMGFFFLIRKGEKIAEAHMAFLPHAYGQVVDIGKECLQWIWRIVPGQVCLPLRLLQRHLMVPPSPWALSRRLQKHYLRMLLHHCLPVF